MTDEVALDGPLVKPRRSLMSASIAALGLFIVLMGLGYWQVQRLAWKEGLLADIASRVHAAPQPIPAQADWPRLDPDDYEYRHVSATGTFLNNDEALVYDGTSSFNGNMEQGYLVLTPLKLADGSYVIVNRGRVPEEMKDPATRQTGELSGVVTVTGLMRSPEGRNPFTPADEPAEGLWFTSDPALIASTFHLGPTAPFSIDADPTPVPGGVPIGGTTLFDIPNNHFAYALTWFAMAATLVVCFALYCWKVLRSPRPS